MGVRGGGGSLHVLFITHMVDYESQLGYESNVNFDGQLDYKSNANFDGQFCSRLCICPLCLLRSQLVV